MIQRRYGWKRDALDARDKYYHAPSNILQASLPRLVDLRPSCGPVVDQGNLGSCTADATASLIYYVEKHQFNKNPYYPSRLFLYYNARELEGTTSIDAGASLRDVIKTAVRRGACPESMWPYDIPLFAKRPTDICYSAAEKLQATQYTRIINSPRYCMAALYQGFPFVVGISVYESFESAEVASTGIVPMPKVSSEEKLGGHAVMCVGYNCDTEHYIFMNSWGTTWGDKGFFHIPFDYIHCSTLAADFWTIQKLETGI